MRHQNSLATRFENGAYLRLKSGKPLYQKDS